MKKLLSSVIGIIITILSLSSCSGGGKQILGHWNIVKYDCIFTPSAELTPVTRYPQLLFSFEPDGTFSCNTDCNTITGQYTADDTNLNFSNISWTELACDNELMERSIKVLIPEVSSYILVDDTTLDLCDVKGVILIRLERR